MRLDCVITSTNEKPLYIEFIPLFIKTWKKLYPEVDVKIILISEEIPKKYMEYKENIILFEPIEGVSSSFTSQYIRLLYPCILNYKNGVMITDMDMIPMNRTYYTEHIKEYDNEKFIYLRENVCEDMQQFAMCYNVATPSVWSKIFEIETKEELRNRIKNVYEKENKGWCTDQIDLYKSVMNWNRKTNNLVRVKEETTKFNRLGNEALDIIDINVREKISKGLYTDYHCFRPMSRYSDINNEVYNLL